MSSSRRNAFEDFETGTPTPHNAFDSFDDDVFKGSVAEEFDDFESSPPAKRNTDPPPHPDYSDEDHSSQLDEDDDEPRPAPPPPPGRSGFPPSNKSKLPPPRAEGGRVIGGFPKRAYEEEEESRGRPPPPPEEEGGRVLGGSTKRAYEEDAPRGRPPPPPKGDGGRVIGGFSKRAYEEEEEESRGRPPPPPEEEEEDAPRPPLDEEEEYEEEDGSRPSQEEEYEEEDGSRPPQQEEYEEEDGSEEEHEEEYEEGSRRPEEEHEQEYEEEDAEDAPPVPPDYFDEVEEPVPPGYSEFSDEEDDDEPAPPPGPPQEYSDEEEEEYLPQPPPESPDEDEDEDDYDDDDDEEYEQEDEDVLPPASPPPAPHPPSTPPPSMMAPPLAARALPPSLPPRTILMAPPPPSTIIMAPPPPPTIITAPPLPPPEQSEEPVKKKTSGSFDRNETLILMPSPPPPPIVAPVPPPSSYSLSAPRELERKGSQDSLVSIMRPPNHPPPPILKSALTLSFAEEKNIAMRFLRAVDSHTRTVNGTVIRYARDVYYASSLDNGHNVLFVQVAAAVKLLDPELTVDQALAFVNGIGRQAGIPKTENSFNDEQEFEIGLSAVVGVDVTPPSGGEDVSSENESESGASKIDQYSGAPMRKLEQYALWIDSLQIWPPIQDLCDALKSGVLLCRLVEHLVKKRDDPKFALRGVNGKPRVRAPAVQNLELALSIIWKQRVVARNMPTADKIFEGDPSAVLSLLRETFTAFALPQGNAREMFEWYDGVLSHYSKIMPDALINPPHRGLWAAFGGGDSLACVLHFFCSQEGISDPEHLPAVDLSKFFVNPLRVKEVKLNATELFELLGKCDIPLPWSVEDFVKAEDQDMLLVQLTEIYQRLKNCSCALPLVVPGGVLPHHAKQHVSVGHDGEARVQGVIFAAWDVNAPLGGKQAILTAVAPSNKIDNQDPTKTNGKRSFTGYHTFASSHNAGGDLAQGNSTDGLFNTRSMRGGVGSEDMSSEIFFLASASSAARPFTGPPPPVLSDAMAQSSTVSLERALARTHADTLKDRASAPVADSIPQLDAVAEMRARLRRQLPRGPGLLDGSLNGATAMHHKQLQQPQKQQHKKNSHQNSFERPDLLDERRMFELEDKRRRAFLSLQAAKLDLSGASESRAATDAFAERVRAAIRWLRMPRDVMFSNRNSASRCRLFVSPSTDKTGEYVVQWFDESNDIDTGSVALSEIEDIITVNSEDGMIFIIANMFPGSGATNGRAGRASLKFRPELPQEALRMFANLTVLLEDGRRRLKKRPVNVEY